jgi:hypothetical protein
LKAKDETRSASKKLGADDTELLEAGRALEEVGQPPPLETNAKPSTPIDERGEKLKEV